MSDQPTPSRAALLFSGGRDSTLAAAILLSNGTELDLVTCRQGIEMFTGLGRYRRREIVKRFPTAVTRFSVLRGFGSFRRIVLADIEDDARRLGINLLLLGSQLAAHVEGILYARHHHIATLCSGFAVYQSHLPEQRPAAIAILRGLCEEYELKYNTPVWHYDSELAVKTRLLDFGLSTKSLEGLTVFGDILSEPDDGVVYEYLQAKLPLCRKYIDSLALDPT